MQSGIVPRVPRPDGSPRRYSHERLLEVDSTIDVLVRHTRRGRGVSDLALILSIGTLACSRSLGALRDLGGAELPPAHLLPV